MLISELDSIADEHSAPIEFLQASVANLEGGAYLSEDFFSQMSTALAKLPSISSETQKLQLWKLSYRIWNYCVEIANKQRDSGWQMETSHVKLRQLAADLLLTAGENRHISASLLKIAMFFTRTGTLWHQLKNFEIAEACFARATELTTSWRQDSKSPDKANNTESLSLMFEIYTMRAQSAWELGQRPLASNLLARAIALPLPERSMELSNHYLNFGRLLLSNTENLDSAAESIPYFEQAYELTVNAIRRGVFNEEGSEPDLASMKQRILRYLAGAHIQSNQFEAALKCIASLKLQKGWHVSIPYLELKSLVGLRKMVEAEQCLISLLNQEGCTAELAAAGVEALLGGGINATSGPVINMILTEIQKRFPFHQKFILVILEKLLNCSSFKQSIDLGLDIAKRGDIRELFCTGSDSDRECLYGLLWNAAASLFQAKDFATCKNIFELCMLYLDERPKFVGQKAKVLRVLTLCHLGNNDLDQAEECVTLAEQLQSSIASTFLKFKIYLQKKDPIKAAQQLESMCGCQDFDPDYLALACHEAVSCHTVDVAIAALSRILSLHAEGVPSSTKEVVVLRNIITLTVESTNNELEAIKYLEQAQLRLSELGAESFLGEPTEGNKEALWFAGTAWNYGLNAGNRRDWSACTRFFPCSADFYGAISGNAEAQQSQIKALLLAAASVMVPEGDIEDDKLKIANYCLEKCRKVAGVGIQSMDTACQVHFYLLLFNLKIKLKEFDALDDILVQCRNLSGMTAGHFYQMSLECCDGIEKSRNVAMSCLQTCLQRILILVSPDYAMASSVIRKLILLADAKEKDGAEVLSLYKEVDKLLIGLPTDTYPKDELQWLISTAWNRAPVHVKFRRFAGAETWMNVALSLLKHSPHMQSHKSMMEGAMQKLADMKADVNGA